MGAGSGLFSRNVIPLRSPGNDDIVGGGLDNARWQGPVPQLSERRHRSSIDAAIEPDVVDTRRPQHPFVTEQRQVGWERRISIFSVHAGGAGVGACNAHFRYECLHQGRPLFKAESGAIVYFSRHWKMNCVYKTTGWLYSV